MLERLDTNTLVRWNEDATVGSAARLKTELLNALATGRDIDADLSEVEEIDLTAIQLFWAAARGAEANRRQLSVRVSKTAAEAARDLGFDHFPGSPQGV